MKKDRWLSLHSSKYKTGWQRAMAALAWKLRAELLGHEQVYFCDNPCGVCPPRDVVYARRAIKQCRPRSL